MTMKQYSRTTAVKSRGDVAAVHPSSSQNTAFLHRRSTLCRSLCMPPHHVEISSGKVTPNKVRETDFQVPPYG